MDINVNKHIRGTNYNAEIPFFTKAPAGFYDIADEREKEALNPKDLLNRSLQELDGKKKLDMSEAKKNDAKKQRQKKNAGEYAPQEALRLAEEVRLKRTDRKEMNLPAPQVSDMELEEIIKIGYASETVRQTVGTDGPSNALLNKATPVVKDVGRTPLVASSQDTLRMEARNIKNLSSSQTPLLGGDIQIEGENSFTATPRNVTATPSSFSSFTPRSQVNQFNPKLASKFMKLPMPKNEFSIVVPENEIFEELGCLMVEDAEEVASRRLIIEQEEEQARLMKLSRPVFFDLPRPLAMNMSAFDEVKGESEVDRLIRIELKSIMMHDALENPYPGSLLPNYSQSGTPIQ